MASILEIIVRQKKEGSGVKQSEKDIKGLEKNLGKLGKAATIASAAMAAAFVKISVDAIKLAGDMEEMESKFDAVFKETAPAARKELEAFGDEVNRSKFELMAMASTVQDTFVPLGFARDEAKGLSVQLTKLAVDVASFNNALEPEVMASFQSAIVGNVEAVRKYGIVMTQPTIQAELFAMGIEGGLTAATEQEKALARLNIIIRGTEDAHGDAAKTADSFVNTMKGLEAQIEVLKVSWGQTLMPLAQDTVKWLSADAEAWVEVDKRVKDGTAGINDNIVSRYTLFRRIRDEILIQRENEEGWRAIDEAMGPIDDKLRNLSDQSLPQVTAALEDVPAPTRMAMETLTEFGNAAEITAGKVDTNLTGSISGFLKEIDFLLAGGADIQAAFMNLKAGVEAGAISEEDGKVFAEGLFVAAQDLQVELGEISAADAAKNIQSQLGGSLDEAKGKLDGIDQAFNNLNRSIKMEIGVSVGGPGAQFALDGGFQHGGSFTVGGQPGADANLVAFKATRGERVSITPAGQSSTTNNDNSQSLLQGANINIHSGLDEGTFDDMIRQWMGA